MIRIHKNGEEWEPLNIDEVQNKIQAGELTANDWVWDEHTETWAPLCELFPQTFPTMNPPAGGETGGPPPDPVSPDPFQDENLFLGDGQRKKLVRMVLKTVQGIAEPDEELDYIATQRKPIPDLTPEALALTNQRIFVFEKGHFKNQYDEFHLTNVLNPQIKSGLFFSHITFSAGAGEVYGVRFLPKRQGKKFFNLLESHIREKRARRNPQPKPGAKINPAASASPLETPLSVVATQPPPEMEEHDHAILHRLETLKQMLDEDLISPEDYETKKKNLIEQL